MAELPKAIHRQRTLDPAQAEHAADWADTFTDSSTNLAQRQRYNKDILTYENLVDSQNQEAFQERLLTDKNFATNYYKGLAEQRQREMENSKMRMDTVKQAYESELHPLRIRKMEADMASSLAKEKRDAANAVLKAQLQTDADYDEANFAYGLSEARSQFGANTPEYHAAVLDLNERFPNAPEAYRRPHVNSAVAAEARRVEREAIKKQAAIDAGAAGLPVREVLPSGGIRYADDPKSGSQNSPVSVTPSEAKKVVGQNALKELTKYEGVVKSAGLSFSSSWEDIKKALAEGKIIASDARDLNHYIGQLSESLGKSKDDRTQLDTIYHGLKDKVAPSQDAPASQAKEQIAVNPKTGERMVLRNGQWQPLK